MKKYMMRAPASPFANPTYYEVFEGNLIGGNAGNLLFWHSVTRALLTEDAEIDCVVTGREFEDSEVEQFNSEYDAFIIPLANAFRPSFVSELRYLTALIRRLTIPCVVIGVGSRSEKIGTERDTLHFDEAVREFCDAVLEKSSIIGIRGRITASYLEKLGYKDGRDFTVIGCPSMYMYGADLPKPKPLNLTEQSRISVNCKVSVRDKMQAYLRKTCKAIPDHYYIIQNLYEMETLFLGRNLLTITDRFDRAYKNYPVDYKHPLYKQNRVRAFVSAQKWLNFMKDIDLSFGTRIHGNIAAILSGVPAFIVAPDTRVLELAEYHNIPHTTVNELDTGKTIFELVDGVDFSSVLNGHRERFEHYLDFLHKNGLTTVFDSEDYGSAPCKFDRKIKKIKFRPPMEQSVRMSYKYQYEAARIWDWLIGVELEKNQILRDRIAELKEETSRIKQRHCGRISISVGRWTLNFFKRR